MKKLVASVLVLAVAIAAAPINLIAAGRIQAGQIARVASFDCKPLANVTVRLRNIDTGQLVGNTTANASGQFSFTGLGAGNFVVETVAANGTILGTSTAIALTAAAMTATGITVGTSATALAAAGGVSGAAAGAGVAGGVGATAGGAIAGSGGIIGALGSTAGLVAITGGAIGATTLVIKEKDKDKKKDDASPSS